MSRISIGPRRSTPGCSGSSVCCATSAWRAFAVPGGSVLLLFRAGGSTEPSPVPGGMIPPHDGRGTQHLCFAVPIAELDAWAAHLTAAGVPIESRVSPQSHGGTSFYFRDPDGHSLEVAGPGLWQTH